MAIYSDNLVGLALFQFELLRNQTGLVHGISTRHAPRFPLFPHLESSETNEWEVSGGGKRPMLLNNPIRYATLIRQRRLEFLAALGLDAPTVILSLTAGQQRHTANVACIGPTAYGAELNWRRSLPDIDAVVTDLPNLPLMTIHADCPPLILFDPVQKVAATVHSGWRGTVGKIGLVAVETMMQKYGCLPANILAGIGPSIGPCCYQVGEPVLTQVCEAFGESAAYGTNPLLQNREGSWYFDLWAANCLLLLEAGLLPTHIENSQLCTFCHADLFFSYRAIGEAQRHANGYGLFGSIVALTQLPSQ